MLILISVVGVVIVVVTYGNLIHVTDSTNLLINLTLFFDGWDYPRHSHCYDISNKSDCDRDNILSE